MKPTLDRETIALRAAKEFFNGAVVNLGIGMGGLAADFIPEGKKVFLMSENGILGFGQHIREDEIDEADVCLIDAQARFVRPLSGMSIFDSADAFGMIRGGHIDITVLGAFQVSERGDLANWMGSEGRGLIGGAMDLAAAAKKLIVTTQHVNKWGEPKIVKKCTLPLTARECVNLIVTDIAVIEVTRKGLVLREFAPGWSVEEIQSMTEPELIVADDLREIEL